MEKKQYDLCLAVLQRLHHAGVLDGMIMIGSWCIPFYEEYFAGIKYRKTIRTRDVDFLIPAPLSFKKNVNVPELLKDLGFVIGYKGSKGYIKLEHPELLVEFLVPEKGRGSDSPIQIPRLGINAVALRFLHFLSENTIKVKVDNFQLALPHPAAYALHKFIIFKRRRNADKRDRDIEGALRVFRALIDHGDTPAIRRVFGKMHKRWQRTIIDNLRLMKEEVVIEILEAT